MPPAADGFQEWSDEDRRIADRSAEGAWLGADEPERHGEQIRAHLERSRLAGLFLRSPAFMAVLQGPDHVFVNANPVCYDLVGHRRLLGQPIRRVFPELEGQAFLDLLDRAFAEGISQVGSEKRVLLRRAPEGPMEAVYVCFALHPLRTDGGETWGLLVLGVDVTERVRTRRQLAARERQQRFVAELGRRALGEGSLDTLARSAVNRVAEELEVPAVVLLRRTEEASGYGTWASAGLDDALLSAVAEAPGALIADVARGDAAAVAGPDHDEDRLAPALREEGFRAGAAVPLADGGGSALDGALAVFDREARPRDEDDLRFLESVAHVVAAAARHREVERFASTLLANLPGFAYRCRLDRSWTMLWLSGGVRDTTGYLADELVRNAEQAYGDLVHPEDRDRLWEQVNRAVEQGEPFRVRYRIRTRNGDVRWMWEQGRAVRTAPEAAAHLEGYIFDVTEEERREAELRSSRRRLQRLSRELLDVQERERQRLSRALHDSLAQQLIGARMALATIAGEGSGADARDRLRKTEELLAEAIEQVRSLSARLRPAVLDDLGLEAALEYHAGQVEEMYDLGVELRTELASGRLSEEVEAACYRIVQEALSNVVRHSGATGVRVTLVGDAESLRLRVVDDGEGFDPEAVDAGGPYAGLGLLTMEERTRALGGVFSLKSQPGQGTAVEARLPVS